MLNFVRRLHRNESGNVLMLGAALMPVLLGSAGLAVDTVQIALWKRQLQRAADSAAIAGAHALSQGAATDQAIANDLDEHVDLDLVKNEQPVVVVSEVTPGSWAGGEISSQTCAARGLAPCYSQAVRVGLTGNRKLPFLSVFTRRNTEFTVDAAAAVVGNGEFCFEARYSGPDSGITGAGGGKLDLDCGMFSNSNGTDAISFNGSIEIIASPIAAVGNVPPSDKNYEADVVLQPYSVPVPDRYAGIQFPTAPAGCTGDLPGDVTSVGNNACYVNWDVGNGQNIVIADNSTVFVNGGEFDIKGSVTGKNVTIILLGQDSTWSMNGGGKLDITAPTSGPLKGIALYRDRTVGTTSGKEVKLNGGADMKITGTIYMPSTDIWIGGNTDIVSDCLQVIGYKLEFKGGGEIKNQCSGTGANPTRHRIIRLVK